MKAIGLREVGGVDEESNVMNSAECTQEVQRVFDSLGMAEFDPKLLRESRQTEIDFVDQLEVHRKRPTQCASSILVIPTKRLDEGGAKQLQFCSRLCEKEPEWSSSVVKCATLDMRSRKIAFLDASVTCLVASATCGE